MKQRTIEKKRAIAGWLFIAPWLLGIVLFFIQPLISLVRYSVTDFQFMKAEGSMYVALEGGWWENEARSFFDEIVADSGEEYAFGTRRFAFMPTPKSDDGKSDPDTTLISSTGNSVAFIAANTAEPELAKDFLRFVHSDHGLRTFTRMTGAIRPYDYELEEGDLAEMTHYAKNMWEIYHSEDTEISYVTLYYNDCFVQEASFLGSNWWWKSTVNGREYLDAMWEFSQEPSLNAENYFLGLQTTFSQSVWNNRMSKYFD